MRLKEIPIKELLVDKQESLADIKTCELALQIGVEKYSGGEVRERLEVNKKIVIKINEELKRR